MSSGSRKDKRRRKRDYCDGCDGCDLSLFTLLAGSSVAAFRSADAGTSSDRPGLMGPDTGAAQVPTGSAARVLHAAVRVYQTEISPGRPSCCRFTPTCSSYAATALVRHGAWRGSLLTVRRLRRCRPGGARGHDPVP